MLSYMFYLVTDLSKFAFTFVQWFSADNMKEKKKVSNYMPKYIKCLVHFFELRVFEPSETLVESPCFGEPYAKLKNYAFQSALQILISSHFFTIMPPLQK